MEESNLRNRIGEILGIHLAHSEQDLFADPENTDALVKIRTISETYRNFAAGGLAGFKDDFDHGYQLGKSELYADLEAGFQPRSDLPNPGEPK